MMRGTRARNSDARMAGTSFGGFQVATAFLLAPALNIRVEREVQAVRVASTIAEVAASLQRRYRKPRTRYIMSSVVGVVLHIGARPRNLAFVLSANEIGYVAVTKKPPRRFINTSTTI